MSSKECVFKKFPELLQTYRKRKGFTQGQLGQKVGVSAVSISYYEAGTRVPRDQEVLNKIAIALELTAAEREGLLFSTKYSINPLSEFNSPLNKLAELLEDSKIPLGQRNSLAFRIKRVIDTWEQERDKQLCNAVIPVAGWQSHIMSPEITARLVRQAIDETKGSGIKHYIIVASKNQDEPLSTSLSDLIYAKHVRIVVQDYPFGLGHAIQRAQKFIPEHSPFAVILPDESVENYCFEEMIQLYNTHKCCVVALRKIDKNNDEDIGGIAFYNERDGDVCKVDSLIEKPSKAFIPTDKDKDKVLAIIGRYILTPDIFIELESAMPNRKSFAIELTDVLDKRARSQPIYGYIYTGSRRSIALKRPFWESHLKKFLKPASE